MNRRTFLGALAAGFAALLGLRPTEASPVQWKALNDARPRPGHVNVALCNGQFRAIVQPGERIQAGQLLVCGDEGTLRPYRESDGSNRIVFVACGDSPESLEPRKVVVG